MNRRGRTFVAFCISILLNVCFISTVYAQSPTPNPLTQQSGWYDQGYAESIGAAQTTGDVNAAAHVSNVNTNSYADLVRRTLGPVPGITTTDASMNSPRNQYLLSQSAVYNVASYIGAMYVNPPASTYAFVQDMGQTLGFIPKSAHAQGIGFSGLSALLPVWKAFRNIAYLLLAVIMTVIGFMVMFRKKIDPKTVITVQSALPRIVVTLLLITFSYAIVGLTIDVMYILIAIVIGIFQSTGLFAAGTTTPANYIGTNLLSSVFSSVNMWELPFRLLGFRVPPTLTNILMGHMGSVIAFIVGTAAFPGSILVGIGILLIGFSGVLFAALIGIGLLLLTIRLFVFFLSTYIKIILALIFSPLQLVMGAIPGNDAFGSWFKNLIANILIFPASAAMFMLAALFMQFSASEERLWVPPYVGFVSASMTSIGALVALGLLFAIPNVGKQIQEALKSKGGMSAGLEGVSGAFSGPTQMGMQLFQYWSSHQQMAQLAKTISGQKTGGGDAQKKT